MCRVLLTKWKKKAAENKQEQEDAGKGMKHGEPSLSLLEFGRCMSLTCAYYQCFLRTLEGKEWWQSSLGEMESRA